jgi:Cysteine-rich CPXCG
MQETAVYTCASCGEENETFLDLGGGHNQEYVEDCQVCCRPNILRVEYDDDYGEVVILAVAED